MLLKHKLPWIWKKSQAEAFEKSKKLLLSSQVLIHFDPDREICLGHVTLLTMELVPYCHTKKPIAFMSRTLSEAKKKYALACVAGVTRFRAYLYSHRCILQTDRKPLHTLFNANNTIPEHAANQGALTLALYEYTITWRNTNTHANADALSRLPVSATHSNDHALALARGSGIADRTAGQCPHKFVTNSWLDSQKPTIGNSSHLHCTRLAKGVRWWIETPSGQKRQSCPGDSS